jgi:hypothetical protein
MVKAEGYAWNATTRDWTQRVVYEARDRMEAIRWMNFNRDWFQRLRILD